MTPICGEPTATLEAARAWARHKRAHQLAEVDRYLSVIWSEGSRLGLDPAGVAAQSSEETAGWTSPLWTNQLNPAGLGKTGSTAKGSSFTRGDAAAWAHLVHLLVYARPTILQRISGLHLALDDRFAAAWFAGYAGTAKSYADLGGKWATDPNYGDAIYPHYTGILSQLQTPTPTPAQPGAAPLPAGIEQVSSHNWSERTNGQHPVAIVYHITDDMELNNVLGWFQTVSSNASAHAVIARDGRIFQVVSSTKAAWANNDVKNPRTDIPWLTAAVTQNWVHGGPMSLNDFTLSIEHVGTPDQPPTDAQYRSSIALSAYWRDRYSIKPNRGHLLRHADIDSVDRSYCPGPHFDLERVIKALGGDPADLIS